MWSPGAVAIDERARDLQCSASERNSSKDVCRVSEGRRRRVLKIANVVVVVYMAAGTGAVALDLMRD